MKKPLLGTQLHSHLEILSESARAHAMGAAERTERLAAMALHVILVAALAQSTHGPEVGVSLYLRVPK